MAARIDTLVDQITALGDMVDELLLAVDAMPGPDPEVDSRVRTDDRLRELLVGLERVRNVAEAAQSTVMTAMADEAVVLDAVELAATGEPLRSHGEFLPDEIALLLACTKTAAGRRYSLALRARECPSLAESWRAGRLNAQKVQVIADEVDALTDIEVGGGLDRRELAQISEALTAAGAEYAATHTWTETRMWLRRRVIRLAPEVAELRRGRAEHERRVEITPVDDGMSELWALLPSVEARQVQQALTAAAHDLGSADPRTMDQRRADLLVDWLLGPDHAPVVHLHLAPDAPIGEHRSADTAVVDTAVVETGAWLAGAGPLTELQADDLICSAATVVTVTAGAVGAEPGYRPSTRLDRAVRARDVVCRFPGCRRAGLGAGTGTDLDHTVPWPDGETEPGNLAVLCRRHHRLKHSPAWEVVLGADGSMEWRTPSGRTYVSHPWGSERC